MIIDDQYIIKEFFKKRFNINKKSFTDDIKNYLINRFDNFSSFKETIYRIKYKIYEKPTCFVCGKPVKFYGKSNYVYGKYCSKECKHNGEVGKLMKLTKLKRYGDENYVNIEKMKQTCLERYGVESPFQLEENKNKARISSKTPESKQKIIDTCLKRYGVINPFCMKHVKEKAKINSHTPEVINKQKLTWKNKTNEEIENITKKKRITNKKKSEEEKNNIINKRKQTCFDKYGVCAAFLNEKAKQTNIQKYGIENPAKSNIVRQKLSKIISSSETQEKINNTKKKNHTFNTSVPENESYKLLKEKYPNVKCQYRSEMYPFNCDFYIPEIDTYIECNYHWTHGGKPYIGSDKDKQILEVWKAKNTKYYKNAINTWTISDVKKRNIAKQNNIKYIEFWHINELINFLLNK